MDFADERPEIEVIGTDISPIQPNWVPPNLKFQIEDCEQEWTFEDSSIDYIHARGLNGNVDRFEFTKKVFKALKPKGVVEFVEVCIEPNTKKRTLAANSYIKQWGEFFREAGKKRRKHFMVSNDGTLRQAMETVGFEDIEVCEYEVRAQLRNFPPFHY
jgi:ubiquinone/menaquinone biosynthesis C-methylase UbiE